VRRDPVEVGRLDENVRGSAKSFFWVVAFSLCGSFVPEQLETTKNYRFRLRPRCQDELDWLQDR